MLWSLTNSEIRVVSTSGSWEEEDGQNPELHTEMFLKVVTHSELLYEGDEFTPGRETEQNGATETGPNGRALRPDANSPLQDAQRRLALLDQTQAAVAAALVLDGDAADLHHHLPQLLGSAPTLFRTWELLAGGGQELAQLQNQNQRTS